MFIAMIVAMIADMVGSRSLVDRTAAQRRLDETIAQVHHDAPLALDPLVPTVGDEQQAVYPHVGAALASSLLLQLALPDEISLRFGIGVGAARSVPAAGRELADGPAWWAAREAIDIAHRRQQETIASARTWIVAAPEENAVVHELVRSFNAQAVLRDDVVARLSPRQRRLVYGRCLGRTQRELAEVEGVSQSAVSQTLGVASAAALVESVGLLAQLEPR